jgi:hypothetical protein
MKHKVLLLTLSLLTFSVTADAFDFGRLFSHKGVKQVNMPLYQESCGECHFAYQPGLLPERSWKKIMLPESLEDHFGENAELPEKDRLAVLNFLVKYAAEHSLYKRSIKIVRSLKADEVTLKISEVPYIKRKHSKIPARMISGNKGVRLLSNCNACHTKAAEGSYDDDTVYIPNFGYWDD